mmetsp:Transcript_22599/g.64020  ORF Transcript_22599/g.64020 Transcript_22599/m.64020 type:complete len:90 (-) Transcript_22599:338-607(-)
MCAVSCHHAIVWEPTRLMDGIEHAAGMWAGGQSITANQHNAAQQNPHHDDRMTKSDIMRPNNWMLENTHAKMSSQPQQQQRQQQHQRTG